MFPQRDSFSNDGILHMKCTGPALSTFNPLGPSIIWCFQKRKHIAEEMWSLCLCPEVLREMQML